MQNIKFKIKKLLKTKSYPPAMTLSGEVGRGKLEASEMGQSLIELVVALGIFVIVGSALVFLIFNSYIAGRLASEITQANFLAEEGLEAARSIRDNNWASLTNGDHGLVISGGNWIFQGIEENLGSQFMDGKRKIIIEEIDFNRKKVTSRVTWQFTEARPQEVKLVTYLTNWAGVAPTFVAQLHYRWRNDDGGE